MLRKVTTFGHEAKWIYTYKPEVYMEHQYGIESVQTDPSDCVWHCARAGELVCKKSADPLDGAPFIAGTVTLLKQFHSENTEQFFALLGQYVRSLIASTHGYVY